MSSRHRRIDLAVSPLSGSYLLLRFIKEQGQMKDATDIDTCSRAGADGTAFCSATSEACYRAGCTDLHFWLYSGHESWVKKFAHIRRSDLAIHMPNGVWISLLDVLGGRLHTSSRKNHEKRTRGA